MKKLLMKMFCPSAAKLAGYTADGLMKAANSSPEDVRAKVAAFSTHAHTAMSLANQLAAMAKDGRIDATERDELVKLLTPMFEKVLALV